MRTPTTAERESLLRLFTVAGQDTGQAPRTADFLLAWHHTEENGGWNPADWRQVDEAMAEDMLTVLPSLRKQRCYVEDLGFEEKLKTVWQQWRGTPPRSAS